VGEVDILALNVVENSACSAHEYLNTLLQLASLAIKGNSTIDGKAIEFIWPVLQVLESI
jgi:hypothetical protein